jgi:hypothetical protein
MYGEESNIKYGFVEDDVREGVIDVFAEGGFYMFIGEEVYEAFYHSFSDLGLRVWR